MLGDKCAWLLSMSKKFPAIDDMRLAESIKREIMLCRKEVRHLLREISCGTFYFFPISLSTRSLSLSIIWWQLWITACIKTFGRLWIQETMYLSLSEQTTYFFLLFLSLQLAFVRPNSLPSGNPAQEPWATENSLQQKVFLPITETWDETTGTSITKITKWDKDFFYHYSH